MRTVRNNHSRYVPEATRIEGMRHLIPHKSFKGPSTPSGLGPILSRAPVGPLGASPDAREPASPLSSSAHPQDFGWNVFVKVRHVSLRRSLLHSDALAVYISAYPCCEFTTNPRSIDRYFVPPSV